MASIEPRKGIKVRVSYRVVWYIDGKRENGPDTETCERQSTALWLGDADGKGNVLEMPVAINGTSAEGRPG